VALNLDAEVRQAFTPAVEDTVDDLRDRALDLGHRCVVGEAELEVGHVLLTEAAPGALLGRDRLGFVPALADEVEERGCELVGTDRSGLAQQRWDERGLEIGGRLLFVLAVVRRLSLPPVEPIRRDQHQERGRSAAARSIKIVRGRCSIALCSFSWSSSKAAASAVSSATIRGKASPLRTRAPPVDARRLRGKTARSSTNWFGGTSTARSSARSGSRMTSPRTETGWPHTRHEGPLADPGSVSSAVNCCRVWSHWSPQTLRSTSTTSSKATARLLSR
jgi:hypothetical protein